MSIATQMCGFFRTMLTTCLVCLFAQIAEAFPPAPTFTIHGIARDEFGWALTSGNQATVLIKRDGQIIAEAPVDERPRVTENFRAQVPMDTNPLDPYRPGAQAPGVSFTVEVRFPHTTMLVTTLSAEQKNVGQPGGMLFLDFSVGEDSDGDGIPDAWEWWQLSEMGIGPGDPLWSLDTLGSGDFSGNGVSDYIEYLAGTFAFLGEETFALRVDGFEDDGTVRLRTLLVTQKTYRIEYSDDLKEWHMLPVRVGARDANPLVAFTATDTANTHIYAEPSPTGTRMYRMRLLR